ncbi:hypothetical protein ACEN2I_13160 [Flavobacterium sp. W22_SRS_FK3]|uniref:hypothetical protein n=1 Tax=Flavobacterium sp. W22_SRS_FK3 TaxID=3240275 RepID=UPI003F904104
MIKKYFTITGTILLLSMITSCKDSKSNDKESNSEVTELKDIPEVEESTIEIKKDIADFIPKNYVSFDTIYGDLNKDGLEDCALIIKGTDKSNVITDEYRGKLDRNRRGIIILLNKKNGYELFVKNENCFSSENEDGGVYFAPDLSVEITKGKLFIHYGHGRYGYWQYMFRLQDSDLALIGYDASRNNGPVVNVETSINFLTRKKITNVNTNENADDGEEVFEKTETKITRSKLIKLSEIKDFDELRFFDE